MNVGRRSGLSARPGRCRLRAEQGDHRGHRSFVDAGQAQVEDHLGRWRDLFPLPANEIPSVRQGVSTSSKRRSIRVQQRVEQANSVIDCLNEMYCVKPGLDD